MEIQHSTFSWVFITAFPLYRENLKQNWKRAINKREQKISKNATNVNQIRTKLMDRNRQKSWLEYIGAQNLEAKFENIISFAWNKVFLDHQYIFENIHILRDQWGQFEGHFLYSSIKLIHISRDKWNLCYVWRDEALN